MATPAVSEERKAELRGRFDRIQRGKAAGFTHYELDGQIYTASEFRTHLKKLFDAGSQDAADLINLVPEFRSLRPVLNKWREDKAKTQQTAREKAFVASSPEAARLKAIRDAIVKLETDTLVEPRDKDQESLARLREQEQRLARNVEASLAIRTRTGGGPHGTGQLEAPTPGQTQPRPASAVPVQAAATPQVETPALTADRGRPQISPRLFDVEKARRLKREADIIHGRTSVQVQDAATPQVETPSARVVDRGRPQISPRLFDVEKARRLKREADIIHGRTSAQVAPSQEIHANMPPASNYDEGDVLTATNNGVSKRYTVQVVKGQKRWVPTK